MQLFKLQRQDIAKVSTYYIALVDWQAVTTFGKAHVQEGALALMFSAAGAVQVFALGYDASLVALFYVGAVLALLLVGGVLRAALPHVYEKQL